MHVQMYLKMHELRGRLRGDRLIIPSARLMEPVMSTSSSRDRDPVWIALVLVFGLLIGTGGGVLSWLSGQVAAAAVLTGGAAFTAAVTLGLLILAALRG